MQNDSTYSNLIANVRTKDDLEKLASELDIIKKSLYQVKLSSQNSSLQDVLKNSVREKTASEVQSLFASSEDHEKVLADMEAALAELKVLHLKVAFEPTEDAIEKIFSWVTSNLGSGVIIDFEFDPEIVGGAEISFNGKYVDLSARKALDNYNF